MGEGKRKRNKKGNMNGIHCGRFNHVIGGSHHGIHHFHVGQQHEADNTNSFIFIGDDSSSSASSNGNSENQQQRQKNTDKKEKERGEEKQEEEEDEELVTPFGRPGSKLPEIISRSSSLIISFFTEQLNAAILADFSGGEVLAVFFIVMSLVLAVAGPIRKLISTRAGKGYGWRLTLGMFIDFVTTISVVMTFGFAARYLGVTWSRLGFNLQEKIVTTLTLAFSFFGAYAFYLSQHPSH